MGWSRIVIFVHIGGYHANKATKVLLAEWR
jgi:hypothetical protein